MKKILLFTMILASFTIAGCKKKKGCTDATAVNYDSNAEKSDGSCTYKGTITFWKKNVVVGDVNITMNGDTKVVTANYVNSPDCGGSGCATFIVNPGTYSFTGTEIGGASSTYSSNVVITSNGCITLELL